MGTVVDVVVVVVVDVVVVVVVVVADERTDWTWELEGETTRSPI